MTNTLMLGGRTIHRAEFIRGQSGSIWLTLDLSDDTSMPTDALIIFCNPTNMKNKILWAYEEFLRNEAALKRMSDRDRDIATMDALEDE